MHGQDWAGRWGYSTARTRPPLRILVGPAGPTLHALCPAPRLLECQKAKKEKPKRVLCSDPGVGYAPCRLGTRHPCIRWHRMTDGQYRPNALPTCPAPAQSLPCGSPSVDILSLYRERLWQSGFRALGPGPRLWASFDPTENEGVRRVQRLVGVQGCPGVVLKGV